MFSLIKKELREHTPVAALGLAAGLLLSAYHGARGARFVRDSGAGWSDESLTLPIVRGNYTSSLLLICAALGFALGFLLSWKEEWKGTWAFLLHRPVTRGQILRAKLGAGALLYLGATVLPYGLMVWWSAMPGNYPAPWTALHLLTGGAILASGLVVLVAAFLAGLRPARWYATRFVPVAAAVSLLFAGLLLRTWTSLYAMALLALVLLGFAARERFAGSARLRPLVLVVLALGLVGPGFFGVVVVVEEVNDIRRAGQDRQWEPWTQYVFTTTGEPRALTRAQPGQTLRTLEGEDVQGDQTTAQIEARLGRRVHLGDQPGQPYSTFGRVDEAPVQLIQQQGNRGATRLFVKRAEGVLQAMDLRTARAAGFWGRNGLSAERGAVDPFKGLREVRGGENEGVVVVSDDEGVYCLNQATGQAKLVFSGFARSSSPSPEALFVRSETEVEVTPLANGELGATVRFPLPESLTREPALVLTALPEGVLGVVVERTVVVDGQSLVRARMVKLRRDDGAIVWERTIERAARSAPPEVTPVEVAELLGISALSPLGVAAIGLQPRAAAPRFEAVLGVPWQLAMVLSAWIVYAIAAQVVLRRAELTPARRAAYSVFAAAFGLPGLLALRAELDDVRIPCPGCKAARLPASASCPGCGAGWPEVETRDIDIRSPVVG